MPVYYITVSGAWHKTIYKHKYLMHIGTVFEASLSIPTSEPIISMPDVD